MLDPELKKTIIMEHYQNPINRNTIEDNRYIKVNSNSETCIDDIDLYILFEDNKIKDLHFPDSAIIGGVVRDGVGIIALGGFQIKQGDRVVVCCLPQSISKVEKLFV